MVFGSSHLYVTHLSGISSRPVPGYLRSTLLYSVVMVAA